MKTKKKLPQKKHFLLPELKIYIRNVAQDMSPFSTTMLVDSFKESTETYLI